MANTQIAATDYAALAVRAVEVMAAKPRSRWGAGSAEHRAVTAILAAWAKQRESEAERERVAARSRISVARRAALAEKPCAQCARAFRPAEPSARYCDRPDCVEQREAIRHAKKIDRNRRYRERKGRQAA